MAQTRALALLTVIASFTGCGYVGTGGGNKPSPGSCYTAELVNLQNVTTQTAVLQGDVSLGCDGTVTCKATSATYCRVHIEILSRLKQSISASVDTFSGTTQISFNESTLGVTTNLEPREHLVMCPEASTYYSIYLAMTPGAEVSGVTFYGEPPERCTCYDTRRGARPPQETCVN